MLQKHLGYEKAFIFHELFHEKKLSKLPKYLSDFELKQGYVFVAKFASLS